MFLTNAHYFYKSKFYKHKCYFSFPPPSLPGVTFYFCITEIIITVKFLFYTFQKIWRHIILGALSV